MMRWPSATVAFSSVRRYMDAMAWLSLSFSATGGWRRQVHVGHVGRAPADLRHVDGEGGGLSRSSPSTPASRFRKPEP